MARVSRCSLLLLMCALLAGCQTVRQTGSSSESLSTGSSELPRSTIAPQPVDMGPAGSKPVTLYRVVLSAQSGTAVGKVTSGWLHVWREDLTAQPGEGSPEFLTIGREELRKAHYTIPPELAAHVFDSGKAKKMRYELAAVITLLRLDVNYVPGWSHMEQTSKGHMTVEWQVFDRVKQQIVFREIVSTRFVRTAKDADVDDALFAMFRENLRSLLANRSFVRFMRPEHQPMKAGRDQSPLANAAKASRPDSAPAVRPGRS